MLLLLLLLLRLLSFHWHAEILAHSPAHKNTNECDKIRQSKLGDANKNFFRASRSHFHTHTHFCTHELGHMHETLFLSEWVSESSTQLNLFTNNDLHFQSLARATEVGKRERERGIEKKGGIERERLCVAARNYSKSNYDDEMSIDSLLSPQSIEMNVHFSRCCQWASSKQNLHSFDMWYNTKASTYSHIQYIIMTQCIEHQR